MPSQTRNKRQKLRRLEAQEFEDANGPVIPDYVAKMGESNADLRGGMDQGFGQQSDRAKVFLRNKRSHDDAVTGEARLSQQYRELLVDNVAWSSMRLAEKIKREAGDPRAIKTIAKVVQKIRMQLRADPNRAASNKLTVK